MINILRFSFLQIAIVVLLDIIYKEFKILSENNIQKKKNIYLSKLNPNRAKINSAFDVINVKMIQLL